MSLLIFALFKLVKFLMMGCCFYSITSFFCASKVNTVDTTDKIFVSKNIPQSFLKNVNTIENQQDLTIPKIDELQYVPAQKNLISDNQENVRQFQGLHIQNKLIKQSVSDEKNEGVFASDFDIDSSQNFAALDTVKGIQNTQINEINKRWIERARSFIAMSIERKENVNDDSNIVHDNNKNDNLYMNDYDGNKDLVTTLNHDPNLGVNSNPKFDHKNDIKASIENNNIKYVKGFLEFGSKYGSGYEHGSYITVHHFIDNQKKEKGTVNVKDGTFDILINEPNGHLLAEIHNRSGEVIGSGFYALEDSVTNVENSKLNLKNSQHVTSKSKYKSKKDKNIKITIKSDSTDGLHGYAYSAYSYGDDVRFIKNANISLPGFNFNVVSDELGRFHDDIVREGSTLITESVAEDHWKTLDLCIVGKNCKTKLFSKKMISAFLNCMSIDESSFHGGIVWGEVKGVNGPLKKVRIETAGDIGKIVYFNSLHIPDSNLKETSESGLFAVILSTQGIVSLRAISTESKQNIEITQITQNTQNIESQDFMFETVPVGTKSITPVSFDFGMNKKIVPVKVFDAFNSSVGLSASVKETQVSDEATDTSTVGGIGSLAFSSNKGFAFVEANSGSEYLTTRLTKSRSINTLNFPMIKWDWIMDMAHKVDIDNGFASKGIVVGFFSDSDKQIFLEENLTTKNNDSTGNDIKIIYFDSQGLPIIDGNKGVKGGGYVIFNVNPGFHQIVISSEKVKSNGVISHLFVAEGGGIVNLLSEN